MLHILQIFDLLQNILLVWIRVVHLSRGVKERRNNNLGTSNNTNRKGICKNCGDDISQDSDSDTFCSEQCGVEYQMEHDRK
jgi:hypothetical protein